MRGTTTVPLGAIFLNVAGGAFALRVRPGIFDVVGHRIERMVAPVRIVRAAPGSRVRARRGRLCDERSVARCGGTPAARSAPRRAQPNATGAERRNGGERHDDHLPWRNAPPSQPRRQPRGRCDHVWNRLNDSALTCMTGHDTADSRSDSGLADPLAWRPLKAPSLAEFEVIATEAFRRLPKHFRASCEGVVVHVEDYADRRGARLRWASRASST